METPAKIETVHVNTFIHSFIHPHAITMWNKLPNNVVNVATIDEFKPKLPYDLLRK